MQMQPRRVALARQVVDGKSGEEREESEERLQPALGLRRIRDSISGDLDDVAASEENGLPFPQAGVALGFAIRARLHPPYLDQRVELDDGWWLMDEGGRSTSPRPSPQSGEGVAASAVFLPFGHGFVRLFKLVLVAGLVRIQGGEVGGHVSLELVLGDAVGDGPRPPGQRQSALGDLLLTAGAAALRIDCVSKDIVSGAFDELADLVGPSSA